jgi:hypothetical protein
MTDLSHDNWYLLHTGETCIAVLMYFVLCNVVFNNLKHNEQFYVKCNGSQVLPEVENSTIASFTNGTICEIVMKFIQCPD